MRVLEAVPGPRRSAGTSGAGVPRQRGSGTRRLARLRGRPRLLRRVRERRPKKLPGKQSVRRRRVLRPGTEFVEAPRSRHNAIRVPAQAIPLGRGRRQLARHAAVAPPPRDGRKERDSDTSCAAGVGAGATDVVKLFAVKAAALRCCSRHVISSAKPSRSAAGVGFGKSAPWSMDTTFGLSVELADEAALAANDALASRRLRYASRRR